MDRPDNAGGLDQTIAFYKRFVKPGVTLADIVVLGGLMAVRECGGPTIPLFAGRGDVQTENPAGQLPDSGEQMSRLREKFKKMGLDLRDMVVLAVGGHTLGFAPAEIGAGPVGRETSFDSTPNKFDKLIFRTLLEKKFVLRMDKTFLENPETQKLIKFYADQPEKVFRRHFTLSFLKMTRGEGNNRFVPLDL